jgi:hypothetical protein
MKFSSKGSPSSEISSWLRQRLPESPRKHTHLSSACPSGLDRRDPPSCSPCPMLPARHVRRRDPCVMSVPRAGEIWRRVRSRRARRSAGRGACCSRARPQMHPLCCRQRLLARALALRRAQSPLEAASRRMPWTLASWAHTSWTVVEDRSEDSRHKRVRLASRASRAPNSFLASNLHLRLVSRPYLYLIVVPSRVGSFLPVPSLRDS